ncbi:MAG: (d)CMP kinase [Alphaproteobacteria bacterium]|jgi:cytidylate kinase|nr:(d)CMP kinase [Alphaproteobacteria bacterium]
MIIAVDGESASGKGTVSKLLAEKLNFAYLDTGLLYRAVAYLALQQGVLENEEAIVNIAKNIKAEDLNIAGLRQEDIGVAASCVAKIPAVREALFSFQVDFANNPPAGKKGAILDGRDIGSVICPHADIKFYVCAALEVRAERRHKDLPEMSFEEIYNALKARDYADKNRSVGALKKLEDAIAIDNTNLNIQETFDLMYGYIQKII